MNGFAETLVLVLLDCDSVLAAGQATFESAFAKQDVRRQLDPPLPFWSAARPVYMEKDLFGRSPGAKSLRLCNRDQQGCDRQATVAKKPRSRPRLQIARWPPLSMNICPSRKHILDRP